MKYDEPIDYTDIKLIEGENPFFTYTIKGDYTVQSSLGVVWTASTEHSPHIDDGIYSAGIGARPVKPLSSAEAELLADKLRGGIKVSYTQSASKTREENIRQVIDMITPQKSGTQTPLEKKPNAATDSLIAMLNFSKFGK